MATAAALERFVRAARAAGVSRDQLARLLTAGAVLQPRQLEASAWARRCDAADGPDELGYGGRAAGKSHWLIAQLGADDCQRFPGLKCLLLRKVGKAGKEGLLTSCRRRSAASATSTSPALNPVL